MSSRRKFLQTAAVGATASMLSPLALFAAEKRHTPAVQPPADLQLGVAGYTFAQFDIEGAINIMKRLNLKNISVKDIHLPLNSSPEKIKSVLDQFGAAGINVYAVGVIYMKTKEAVDQAFTYAKNVGVPMIVGVPAYDLLDYTEEAVKKYNIRIAIHDHGPEDKLYPGPEDVIQRIKDRDARMGICLDIGHAQRAGSNPADAVKKYSKRLFDLHLKDVTANGKEGKPTEMGRGIIDFPAFVSALRKVKYEGFCSFEYEKNMKDPLPGMAESLGFFKGVAACNR